MSSTARTSVPPWVQALEKQMPDNDNSLCLARPHLTEPEKQRRIGERRARLTTMGLWQNEVIKQEK